MHALFYVLVHDEVICLVCFEWTELFFVSRHRCLNIISIAFIARTLLTSFVVLNFIRRFLCRWKKYLLAPLHESFKFIFFQIVKVLLKPHF